MDLLMIISGEDAGQLQKVVSITLIGENLLSILFDDGISSVYNLDQIACCVIYRGERRK